MNAMFHKNFAQIIKPATLLIKPQPHIIVFDAVPFCVPETQLFANNCTRIDNRIDREENIIRLLAIGYLRNYVFKVSKVNTFCANHIVDIEIIPLHFQFFGKPNIIDVQQGDIVIGTILNHDV